MLCCLFNLLEFLPCKRARFIW